MARGRFVALVLVFAGVFVQVARGQQGCADQLQRCGAAAEQFEQQLRAMKAVAFRQCVTQPACQSEMVAFDECFQRSLRTVRQPTAQALTLTTTSGDMVSTAETFRMAIDRCFLPPSSTGSPFAPFVPSSPASLNTGAPFITAIYSADFADILWGLKLPSTSNDQNVCSFPGRDLAQRLFGNGISRTVDSADPRFNNLNTSCLLNDLELQCYRTRLEGDPRYQELVANRNQAIQTCIQSIRLQTQCRPSVGETQMQSCLCNAKEEFELRLQKDFLECVRQSPVSRRQTASLLGAQAQIFPDQFASPPAGLGSDPVNQQQFNNQQQFSNQQLTPGIVRNGQCLCACQNTLTSQGSRPHIDGTRTLATLQSSSNLPWYQNNQYPTDDRSINNGNSNYGNSNWQAQYPDYAQTFDTFYWNNPGRWPFNRNYQYPFARKTEALGVIGDEQLKIGENSD